MLNSWGAGGLFHLRPVSPERIWTEKQRTLVWGSLVVDAKNIFEPRQAQEISVFRDGPRLKNQLPQNPTAMIGTSSETG